MERIANVVVALLALLHIYILVLEMFLWGSPTSLRAFGLTPELAQQTAAMAANQGLYNGFLAAGLLWGLAQGARGRSDDDEDEEEEEELEPCDFYSILEEYKSQWMMTELDHTVSKVATNCFWKLALKFMPKLLRAKEIQKIKRKIPKFKQIRENMYEKKTPKVDMEIGYRNRETDELTVVKDTVTPKSRFPPHQFEKCYEIATVKVRLISANHSPTFLLS